MAGRKHLLNDNCLLFVIPALGSGGAERVITILVNNFIQQWNNIILVYLNSGSAISISIKYLLKVLENQGEE